MEGTATGMGRWLEGRRKVAEPPPPPNVDRRGRKSSQRESESVATLKLLPPATNTHIREGFYNNSDIVDIFINKCSIKQYLIKVLVVTQNE